MSDADDDYNGCVDTWPGGDGSDRDYGLDPNTPPVTVQYSNSQIDPAFELDVREFMKTIGERLCVLQPNLEMNEHYPALKDAYDQYKMLEKLLMETNDVNKD